MRKLWVATLAYMLSLCGTIDLSAESQSESTKVYFEIVWNCGESGCESCRSVKIITSSGSAVSVAHKTEKRNIEIKVQPTLIDEALEVRLSTLEVDAGEERQENESRTVVVSPDNPVEVNMATIGFSISGGIYDRKDI